MSAGPVASRSPSSPSGLRCVGGLGPPAPDRLGGCRELQKFSGKLIQLLAVLALRGTKAIVIDDADLGAQPFPPALTTDPRFDRLTEGPGKPYLAGSLAFDPAPRAADHNHPVMLSAGVTGKSSPRPFYYMPRGNS